VLRLIPCADMPAPIPRRNPELRVAHFTQDGGLPRFDIGSASAIDRFEACSAFTHVPACRLAESPNATLFIEGFGGFVTSSTAPIATGWSDPCQAGLAPAENQTPFTAHAKERFVVAGKSIRYVYKCPQPIFGRYGVLNRRQWRERRVARSTWNHDGHEKHQGNWKRRIVNSAKRS
jgi:hypothetical protein